MISVRLWRFSNVTNARCSSGKSARLCRFAFGSLRARSLFHPRLPFWLVGRCSFPRASSRSCRPLCALASSTRLRGLAFRSLAGLGWCQLFFAFSLIGLGKFPFPSAGSRSCRPSCAPESIARLRGLASRCLSGLDLCWGVFAFSLVGLIAFAFSRAIVHFCRPFCALGSRFGHSGRAGVL